MRAYSAILIDSFREAFASRVLWLLVAVITLILAVIACLSVNNHASWNFTRADFPTPTQLAVELHEAGQAPTPSIGQFVWQQLSADSQKTIAKLAESNDARPQPGRKERAQDRLADSLRELLSSTTLKDSPLWKDVDLSDSTLEAMAEAPDARTEESLAEMNRRLLEGAFSSHIERSPGNAYYVKFLTWEFPEPIGASRRLMEKNVNMVLVTVIQLFLGVGGVLIAILVTSSMIPRTFEAGSIDLLLSKPITRVGLFLTKYFGGCAFILLNAAYFLAGLWLIVGWRAGIWNTGLLRSIHVFLFLFAVYYAVSAVAGLLWRNAIVSVVVVVIFWFSCFAVGQLRQTLNLLWFEPQRIESLGVSDGQVWGTSKNGSVQWWDAELRAWREILAPINPQGFAGFRLDGRLVGPVYDPTEKRMIALPGDTELRVPTVVWGTTNDGQRLSGAESPANSRAIYRTNAGKLFAVCAQGIYLFTGDITLPPQEQTPFKIFGKEIPLPIKIPAGPKSYASVGPDPWPELSRDFVVDFDQHTNQLAFYDDGHVIIMSLDDEGRFRVISEAKLESGGPAALALRSDHLFIAQDNGALTQLAANPVKVIHTETLADRPRVDRISAHHQGDWFAIEWKDNRVDIWDRQSMRLHRTAPSRQGHLTATAFSPEGKLLVVDDRHRVDAYELKEMRRTRYLSPNQPTLSRVYYYLINPIYQIFPKPGELGNLTMYLVTGEKVVQAGPPGQENDLQLDIWAPIWSCAAFTAVTLGVGSLFVWRKDF